MGWLGISLNVATVMVASVALGIVDDDTIHFIGRFRREAAHGASTGQAIEVATIHEGRAWLTTAIINSLAVGIDRAQGVLLIPLPIHAFNPGPMTGSGNWTWLIDGRLPTLIDAGTGDPRHVDAVAAALEGGRWRRCWSRTATPTTRRVRRPSPPACRTPVSSRCRGPNGTPRFPSTGGRSRTTTSSRRATRRSWRCTRRATPPIMSASGTSATRSLFGGDLVVKGQYRLDSGQPIRGRRRVHRVARAGAGTRARSACSPPTGRSLTSRGGCCAATSPTGASAKSRSLDALRQGDSTSDAMTARIYRGLKRRLIPLARESVTAHLRKLEREGRARCEGEAWHIIEP